MNRIQKIGLSGSGKMGSDIFNYLTNYSFNLAWFTRNTNHKIVLREAFEKKIKRQLKHGIINQDIFDIRNAFKITSHLTDLADCDLIIESVIEDQPVKTELFETLEKIVRPSCIMVSNSSSILPSKYSQNTRRQNRIAGIHFFYPMAIKNITELIFSDQTDELTRETLRLFLDTINRFYIELNEENAFILNRFLLEIQIKAYDLHKQFNIDFQEIDEIGKSLVPDFGLFEVMDQVGHQTMYNSILNYSQMDSDKSKYKPLLNELELKLKNKIIDNQSFYGANYTNQKIDKETSDYIYNTLKNYLQEILTYYSANFNLNIYAFKKALQEFCGIIV